MRTTKQRGGPRGVAALVVTAALALTACTSVVAEQAAEDASTAGPPATGDSTTTVEAADVPRGGTLVMAMAADPQPQAYNTGRPGNLFWSRNVLETLIAVDTAFEPQPVLATEWAFEDDNRTFIATLREGVTFHSGRDFTAEDVVFALENAADGGGFSHVAGEVAEWEISATGTHEVTITSPLPLQESIFDILDTTPMIDRDTYEGIEDGSEVVGTGPFVWEEYSPGSEIRLVAYDDYWDPERPYLDEVQIAVIGDSTAQLSALRTGRAQVANGLSITDTKTLTNTDEFSLNPIFGLVYRMTFDVTSDLFDTREIRQAIGYALDRDRINDQVFGGLATMPSLYWAEQVTGYPADLEDTYTYDPDRAREMIEAAGATGAEINVLRFPGPVTSNLHQVVANNLEAVGLTVTGEELQFGEFAGRRGDNTLSPAWFNGDAQVGVAPSLLVTGVQELRAGENPTHHQSEEYTQLVAALRESADDESTAENLRALSEYMLDEAFTQIVAQVPQTDVVADEVEGMFFGRYGRSARDAYLTD